MTDFLNFYSLFHIIQPACVILIIFSVMGIIYSVVLLNDYSLNDQQAYNLKLLAVVMCFVFLSATTILSVFSYREKHLFYKYIGNNCTMLKKIAIITNDGKYKIKYFDTCVER